MERDQIFEKEPRYPSTTTPHFDEEWTVLTARPVVPLNEVKSQTRRRAAWKLVSAFAVAVVLGAFVALLSVGLSQSTNAVAEESSAVPEQTAAIEQTLSEQTAVTEPSPVPSVSTVVSETQNLDSTPTMAPKTPVTLAVKAKNSPRPGEKSIPSNTSDSSDDPVEDSLEATPPKRVIDRFEERRMRRVFRQQRRERAANRQRDLLRIDELFEGRRP